MDEALSLPSEVAARVALRTQQIIAHESGVTNTIDPLLRTQQIIAHESGVTNTIDPLGGSYYLEALTNRLEEEAYRIFEEIEALGGVVPAIEVGYFQRKIAESAYKYQRAIDSGDRTIVGANKYQLDEPLRIPLLRLDPEGERRQRQRLARVRRERDNEELRRRLQALREAAKGSENHAKVAGASAITMLQLLVEAGIQPDVVTSGAGDVDDAFLVVLTGALLHDLGNQIHREEHAHWGIYLALPILDRLMPLIYEDPEQRKAGLVAVADGCDLTKGRGRMAFDLGNINIHTVSALSIEEVVIAEGKEYPVEIVVLMCNSAGIFQVQETLTEKILHSPLAGHVTVRATTQPEDRPIDARIVHSISLKGRDFVTT